MAVEILSAILTLVPAAYVWWLGRGLVRRIDDPAFAELRFAHGQRLAFVLVLSVATSLVLSTAFGLAKVILAILAVVAAGFPARRQIFSESWGLLAYMSHALRFWLAMLGIWILLILMPFLIGWAGDAAALVAAGIGIAALAWTVFNARIFPVLVAAAPLADAEMAARFEPILAKARCRRPRLLMARAEGGYWVNAIALPSLFRPGVVFTADLLNAMDPGETDAIFAHELAHLEYYGRKQLLGRHLLLAVLLTVLLYMLFQFSTDSSVFRVVQWAWPIAVLVLSAALTSRNQANEHQSDLRAVELVGQPEALVSALTKTHRLMRMPRRWRPNNEDRLSHPSLAKRVRAIRDAGRSLGLPVADEPPIPELAVRSASQPSEIVVLSADWLHWLTGVDPDAELDPSSLLETARDRRSVRYGELTDLRLELRGMKASYLTAIDGGGATMKLALRREDVASVKAVLETLDLKVRGTSRELGKPYARLAASRRRSRMWAALAMLASVLPPFSFPFAVTALLVLIRPARVTLAAAGAIGAASAVFGLRGTGSPYLAGEPPILSLLLTGLLGFLILYEAYVWSRRGLEEPAGAWKLPAAALAVLGAIYLVGGYGQVSSPLALMELHLWARYELGATLVFIGLAFALFASGLRRAPVPAIASAAAALFLSVLATEWFGDRFGGDFIAASRAELEPQPLTLEVVHELGFEGSVIDLRMSPSGRLAARAVAASQNHNYSGAAAGGFWIEMSDGSLFFIDAVDLAFLGDDRIALLMREEDGTVQLSRMWLEPAVQTEDAVALPALPHPSLRVDASRGRWEVASIDLERSGASVLSGEFGEPRVDTHRWRFQESEDFFVDALLVGAGERALMLGRSYDIGAASVLPLNLIPFLSYSSVSQVASLAESEPRQIALTTAQVWCADPLLDQRGYICMSNDRGYRTTVWLVDAVGHLMTPVGSLSGYYYEATADADGRIVLNGVGVPPTLIELATATAAALYLPSGGAAESEAMAASPKAPGRGLTAALLGSRASGPSHRVMAVHGDLFAFVLPEEGGSRVVVTRFPESAGPSQALRERKDERGTRLPSR